MPRDTAQSGSSQWQKTRVIVLIGVLLAGVGLIGASFGGALAQQSGATEISNWTDLDDIRDDLDGDYILVNDLNETTPGYDEVVVDQTATEFTEQIAGQFNKTDQVTLTRTPLNTAEGVTATNASGTGIDIEVTITDAANGTVEFEENPGDGFSRISFDYSTTENRFVGFDPIGAEGAAFRGTFDGQENTISDLVIDRPTENGVGLFGETADTKLTNVSLSGVEITGRQAVGGLVGENGGVVSNSEADGKVTATGRLDDGGLSSVGGFAGLNFGSVSDVTGDVSVTGGRSVGGIIGEQRGEVSDATASGAVNGSRSVGGLVGSNGGTVSESSASGDVNGSGNLVGGLVGDNFGGTVSESSASGDVNGSRGVGGLVGFNAFDGTVSNSSASGDVNGDSIVSGLVGAVSQGSVTESFAVGSVTGDVNVGGLVGRLGPVTDRDSSLSEEAILRDSYFDTQTTGQSAAVGVIEQGDGTAETRGEVTGLPTSRMQGSSAEIYMSTLDFANTWMTVTDPDDYPVLQAGQSGGQEGPILADYANDQDVVDVDGLLDALDDWRGGEIGVDLLLDVLDAWRSGDPVT